MTGSATNAERPCAICGERKPESDYVWRKPRRDLRGDYCRTCRARRRLERRAGMGMPS